MWSAAGSHLTQRIKKARSILSVMLLAFFISSGGGTRTPETRIMIPNSDCSNLYIDKEKRQEGKSVYTTDSNLQFIIDSWGELPDDIKQTILRIVKIVHSQ